MQILQSFVFVMGLVCVLGFFNEKVTKLTYEIALMLFSIVLGVIVFFGAQIWDNTVFGDLLEEAHFLNIEQYLMDGVLCFMLFSGSCHLRIQNFVKFARQVTVLSLVATFLGAAFYGLLFFGATKLVGLDFSLPVCLMFGSIVAPTDPIAATSILNKFGLPKNISFLIEGESLFNDGVGVALFVCFSGMVTSSSAGNFFLVMARELFGAAAVGAASAALCFLIYKFTKNKGLGIFSSLFSVALAYYLCNLFDFSGAIASVVCGILFGALRSKFCMDEELERTMAFNSFWDTLDNLMNSILYVMLGISFIHVFDMPHVIILSLIAIVANIIARAASVGASTLVMGKIPDNYNRSGFVTLLTWGGLRGGLCVALAMSTMDMIPDTTFKIILGGTNAIVFFTTVVQGLTLKPVYRSITKRLEKKGVKA